MQQWLLPNRGDRSIFGEVGKVEGRDKVSRQKRKNFLIKKCSVEFILFQYECTER